MVQVNIKMADLQPMSLGYEEGQDVTREVLQRADKAYKYFHNKYLELVASWVEPELRDLLIGHDASLEDFVGRVRQVVKSGYYYASMGVFGFYLEYNDTYFHGKIRVHTIATQKYTTPKLYWDIF